MDGGNGKCRNETGRSSTKGSDCRNGGTCNNHCGDDDKVPHCCDTTKTNNTCVAGHPDFQDRPGGGSNMVAETLTANKPTKRTGAGADGSGSIADANSFYDWYRDSTRATSRWRPRSSSRFRMRPPAPTCSTAGRIAEHDDHAWL